MSERSHFNDTPTERWVRRFLLVLALLPIAVGVRVVSTGASRFLDDDLAPIDHQLRYLGGVYLALGLSVVWAVTRPTPNKAVVATTCAAVFVGGLARLASVLDLGVSSPGQYAALAIELSVIAVIPLIWRIWPGASAQETTAHSLTTEA